MATDVKQLKQTILTETAKAKEELGKKLNDPTVKDLGCIDKKAAFKGQWNPPGSAQFVDDEGRLEEWMKTKKSGTFGIHLGCAERYFIVGDTSVTQQKQGIDFFRAKIVSLNQKLKTDFKVIVDYDGSAKNLLT